MKYPIKDLYMMFCEGYNLVWNASAKQAPLLIKPNDLLWKFDIYHLSDHLSIFMKKYYNKNTTKKFFDSRTREVE